MNDFCVIPAYDASATSSLVLTHTDLLSGKVGLIP